MAKYERLEKLMYEKKLSKGQLAMQSNILPCNFYQALNGKREFFPRWRRSVAEVLGVDESEIFPQDEVNKGA